MKALTAALAAKFLFFPVKTIDFFPSQFELAWEDVQIKTADDLKLHGWFFPGSRPDRTLLYFHGNAGNIGDRLDKIRILHRIGWNIFIFDYRGYGGSEGDPTIEGIIKDSEAAFRYLTETRKIGNEQIVFYGESLGGAMATELGARGPVAAVILESTFTSLRDLADKFYPFIPSTLVPDELRSIDKIRSIKSPLLIIHGDQDEVVPFEMGRKLFEAAPHPKRFLTISGGHHNDLYAVARERYLTGIQDFLFQAAQP